MAEYIERGMVLELLKDVDRYGYLDASDINSIPAADVEPVRHGRWVFVEQRFYYGGFVNLFRCSECKVATDTGSNYCPNCGAKMDLEGGTG